MRASLFYNPLVLLERLALASSRRRRFRRLRGTPAARLQLGHLDSLELLELLADRPPAVIYDIGANVGTWTCLAKSLYPHARVDAFEPLPQHFGKFKEWTAPWADSVHLHPVALGAEEHTATMHVMDFSDASSLLPLGEIGRREFKIAPAAEAPVQVLPLDRIIARDHLPSPDLLKLDVQGYELEVLRGAEQCLRQVRAVLCEVSFQPCYDGQPLFGEINRHLTERGFVLHALGCNTPLGSPLLQTDVLFLRPGPPTP